VDVYGVSGDYFALLGARAARGRLIESSDDSPDAPAYTAVLSDRFWRHSFGGDEGILGRTVHLGADQFTIIGVTEPGFAGAELSGPDLWVSLAPLASRFEGADYTSERGSFFLGTIARLRRGVSPETAASQATSAIAAGRADPRVANGFRHVVLGPVQEARGPEAGPDVSVTLWVAGVSLLVLLVACANVGNLLLQRGLARTRELAIRRVMGATHGRLIQQLVIESLLLGVLGGGAAAILALWAGAAVRGLLLPPAAAAAFSLDGRVFALTAIASLTAGIIAGIAPAWRHARGDLTPALKQGSGGAGYRRSRLRDGLMIAQIALSVVLVVGAGLFVRSLRNALTMDLGLEPSRVVMLSANLHDVGYGEAEARQAFSAMREAVIRHPDVERASLSVGAPFGWSFGVSVRLPGRDSVPRLPSGGPYYQAVEPEYRQTVGLALLRGRDFTPADRRGATKVALVSQQTARLFWPNGDELGQCLMLGDDPDCREVVGVVEDGRRNEILEPPQLMVYLPIDQQEFSRFHLTLLVRTRGDPRPVAIMLQQLAQAAYPGLPFVRAQAMQDVIAPQYGAWRMGATIFGLFGALALTLATIGVYSTLAYAVRGRSRELGIRLALGASGPGVVRLVVRDGLRLVALGLVAGTAAALAGGRALASLLLGVAPADPLVMAGTAAVLAGSTVIACALPARRAARVDPMIVLQSE
jgi:predicted permease